MDEILAIVLRSLMRRDSWAAFRDIVTEDVFTNTNARVLYTHILRLHDMYRSGDVEVAVLAADIAATYRDGDRRDELIHIVEEISDYDALDPKLLRPSIRTFVSRQLALQAGQYIGTYVDTDRFEPTAPAELLERAVAAASAVELDVLDISSAPAPDADFVRPMVQSLGISAELDTKLSGGIGSGELCLYLAPYNRGKTSYLWQSTIAAAQDGCNVLAVSLEISKEKCLRRVDQCLTHFTSDEWLQNPNTVLKERAKVAGNLWIADLSHRSPTVHDIRSMVLRMRSQGMPVDYLMLDYLALMAPGTKTRHTQERFGMGAVAKEMRQLANELDLRVLSAWQINRAGSEVHTIKGSHIAECFEVLMHTDIAIGLNQSPEELANKIMRLSDIKQRESTERGMVYVHSDLDRMYIHDSEEQHETIADTMVTGCGPGLR